MPESLSARVLPGLPAETAPRRLHSRLVLFLVTAVVSALLVAANSPTATAGTAAGSISTIAGTGSVGNGYAGDGGAATSAGLSSPNDVVQDSDGNLFVADWTNHVVRMIAATTTACTSSCPFGIATTAGDIYTVAGNGTAGNNGDGAQATAGELNSPSHLALDAAGDLLITDDVSNVIRLVARTACASSCAFGLPSTAVGDIYTIAGTGTAGTNGLDGHTPATSVQLDDPRGIAVGSGGGLYIADHGANEVLQMTSDGSAVSVLAGTGTAGSADGSTGTATFSGPIALAFGPGGNLYVSDAGNQEIRKITFSGAQVSTVAGTGTAGYAGDGAAATSAELFGPDGITFDANGDLFVADTGNNVVREVAAAGATNGMVAGDIYTVAGDGTAGYSGDGASAVAAHLHLASGVLVDAQGNLDTADTGNHVVRQVAAIADDTDYTSSDSGRGSPYAAAVMSLHPTLYYRLGESSAVAGATDLSGHGLNGQYGAPGYAGAPGALPNDADTAAAGDGNSPIVVGPADVSGPPGTVLPYGSAARTVEFWMKEQAPGGNEYGLFEYGGDGSSGKRFGLSVLSNGNLHFEGYGGANHDFAVPAAHNLYNSGWHHIALVYDGTTLTPYVDGISLGGVAISLDTGTDGNHPLRIGSALDNMGGDFPGSIDEFAVYPAALSEAQIDRHVALSGRPPNAPASVTVTPGDNQATVSWPASTTNSGTGDVTDYTVTVLDANGDSASVASAGKDPCSAGSCQYTVTGLAAKTAGDAAPYTAEVSATNSSGVGPSRASTMFSVTGASTSYRTAVLGDNPALYYRLDNDYGSSVADFSGNGLTGFAPPSSSGVDLSGPKGAIASDPDSAVSGGGSGDLVDGPPSSSLPHGSAARTVEFWMKEQAPGPNEYTLFEYGGEGSDGTRFGLAVLGNGNLHFEGYGGTNHDFAVPAAHDLYNSGWHHIALVYDGTTLTPYVDGISLGGVAVSLDTGTAAGDFLRIGGGFDNMGGNFPGSIDEFAVYPAALSGAQIAHHVALSGRPPNAPANVTVTPGANQAIVKWSASTTNPDAAVPTGYTVTIADSNGNPASVSSVGLGACSAGACQFTVTGLAAKTAGDAAPYTAEVSGANAAGDGPAGTSDPFSVTGKANSYRTAVLADDPALYYRLDNDYLSTVADSSGHGLDGFAPPTAAAPDASGALGTDNALAHTGSGPLVAGPPSSSLPNGSAARTVEFWMKENAPGANEYTLFEYGGEGSQGTRFGLALLGNGNLWFEGYGGANHEFTVPAGQSLYNSGWHYVALVYDGTTLTPYVDGVSLGGWAVTLATGTASGFFLRIGGSFDDMGGDFPGSIDDFAVYRSALNADQIASHYLVTTADVPGAPTAVSAAAGTDGQATVSFTAPKADGGAPVTGYTITPSPACAGCTGLHVSDPTATQATVGGLTDGTTYTFTVAADNVVGAGPDSSPASNAVTPTAAGTDPQSDTTNDPTAAAVATSGPDTATASGGTGTVTVAQYGDDPSAPLPGGTGDYLDVRLSSGNTFNQVVFTDCSGTGGSLLRWWNPDTNGWQPVTPQPTLTTDTPPCLKVTLDGSSSPTLAQLTGTIFGAVTPTPAAAPTGVTAGDIDFASASVSWTAPADPANFPITGYHVQVVDQGYYTDGSNAAAPRTVSFDSTATTETVTGLTKGHQYEFLVAAYNGIEGTFSTPNPPTDIAVTAQVPDAPTGLAATASGGQVALNWTAPPDSGLPLNNYFVYRSTSAGGPYTLISPCSATCPTSPSYTDTTVTNGTTYYYEVTAENPLGESAMSGDVSATPQQAQTITFTAPTGLTYGDADSDPGAVATSGLAVSYASNTTSVCTIVSGKLHIVTAGDCSLTATQDGNAAWAAAKAVTRTITIATAPLTITASNASMTAGGPLPTVTPSYSGLVNGDKAPATPPTCTADENSGTTSCSGAADPNYAISYRNGTLTVTSAGGGGGTPPPPPVRQGQTISFTAPSGLRYGDASVALDGTATSGLAVGYASGSPSVCTTTAGELRVVGAGSCTVTATQPGNDTYDPAAAVSRTFPIAPAPLTVTASNAVLRHGRPTPPVRPVYHGLVNGDRGPATPPTCSASARAMATFCSGAADPNYTISYRPGRLRRAQVIHLHVPGRVSAARAVVRVRAVANSKRHVTLTATPAGVCRVAHRRLIIQGTGSCELTAHVAGNRYWAPATRTRTVVIRRHPAAHHRRRSR